MIAELEPFSSPSAQNLRWPDAHETRRTQRQQGDIFRALSDDEIPVNAAFFLLLSFPKQHVA